VLKRSVGAVANALDKLVSLGTAELACGKPRSYRLAPAAATPDVVGCRDDIFTGSLTAGAIDRVGSNFPG
jgi:hypothetical protein